MSSSHFRLSDKRYLIAAFVDNASGSDISKFQSGLDFDAGGNNKTERATGIVNHMFDAVDTDELVIDLLNFLFVENPYADLSDSNRTYRDLKTKVLDVRGLEFTDDGYQFREAPVQQVRHGGEPHTGPAASSALFENPFGQLSTALRAAGSATAAATVSPIIDSEEGAKFSMPANDRVFVVHGRDMRPVEALDQFLGFLNLRMMSWSDAVKLTGEPQPHTYDIVKAGMAGAAAVIVVFSPDDEARTQRQFRSPGESEDYLGQVRQNVLVEAGMAFAQSRQRTIFLQSAATRPITDLEGFNWVKMDGVWDSRADLINRLKSAGANPKPRYDDLMHRTAGPFKVAG